MTALMFAATLGLQAQTAASSSSQSEEQRKQQQQQQSGSSLNQNSQIGADASINGQSQSDEQKKREQDKNKYAQNKNQWKSSDQQKKDDANKDQSSRQADSKYSLNQSKDASQNSANSSQNQNQSSTTAQVSGTQNSSTSTSQTNVAVSGEVDTQVRTVVQQIDAQGPVVVERISTRFADVTCTEENARALIEALHNGTSVTLRGDDGKTATFTPTVHLGYGEAYIAMALAVEALKNAGITGCASPAQWQAVLMGGQLSGGTVATTTTTTERFPGILVLHEQGGGWAKVAQTTHVELNTVVSQANSSLQLNNSSSNSTSSTRQQSQSLSPTGRSSDYNPRADDKGKNQEKSKYDTPAQDSDDKKGDQGKHLGHKMNPPGADDPNNPAKTEQPQARPNQ